MATLEKNIVRDVPVEEEGEARPLLWTKEQYHQISEAGLLDGLRVELIEGEIILMPAIGTRHFTSVVRTTRRLWKIFGDDFLVVAQNGFDAGPRSEPQPDIAVYAGGEQDYKEALPKTALLIVEVADSTLRTDRGKKARLYASIGILDYWIVNLRDEVLEVYRQPLSDPSSPVAYQNVQMLTQTDFVSPLAALDAQVLVADLLP